MYHIGARRQPQKSINIVVGSWFFTIGIPKPWGVYITRTLGMLLAAPYNSSPPPLKQWLIPFGWLKPIVKQWLLRQNPVKQWLLESQGVTNICHFTFSCFCPSCHVPPHCWQLTLSSSCVNISQSQRQLAMWTLARTHAKGRPMEMITRFHRLGGL